MGAFADACRAFEVVTDNVLLTAADVCAFLFAPLRSTNGTADDDVVERVRRLRLYSRRIQRPYIADVVAEAKKVRFPSGRRKAAKLCVKQSW